MGCVLACDLGGSSFRAALVDAAGRVRHLVSRTAPADAGRPRAAEVDPASWWQALTEAADALAAAAGVDFDGVRAIAIAGMTRTQVFLDRDGRPLRPAITWEDVRAERHLPGLDALLPQGHGERRFVNAFHPLARLYWVVQEEPEVLRFLAAVVEPKDYLNLRLTGRLAVDAVSSARLIAAAVPGPDGRSCCDAAGIPGTVLPEVLRPTDVTGTVQAGLPGALGRLTGRPVLAMANDTWACVLGLGALRPGFAYNLSGTTEVLGVVSERTGEAEGLLTVDWGGGLTQFGGPSQNGADTLVWLMAVLGRGGGAPGITAALEALLDEPRDDQPALFLPYLQGERTPYWDPALRGAFLGLNRRHGAGDLAYAVLEGIACLNRIVLDCAEAAAGGPVTEIRFGGGGAANPRWCQIKADATERPVVVVDEAEPGLVGAAIVAFAALGTVRDLAEGQARLVRPRARFDPSPEGVRFHRGLLPLFREAEAALVPLSRKLAGFRGQPSAKGH